MRNRGQFSALRIISVILVLAAIVLTVFQLVQYSRVRAYLPAGLKVAEVHVGGLERQQAAQQLLEAYSVPVEMFYRGEAIHLNPAVVDFQLETEKMLAAADLQRTEKPFWEGFIDYLWVDHPLQTRSP